MTPRRQAALLRETDWQLKAVLDQIDEIDFESMVAQHVDPAMAYVTAARDALQRAIEYYRVRGVSCDS